MRLIIQMEGWVPNQKHCLLWSVVTMKRPLYGTIQHLKSFEPIKVKSCRLFPVSHSD